MVDTQFLPEVEAALNRMDGTPPQVIEIADTEAGFQATGKYPEYED